MLNNKKQEIELRAIFSGHVHNVGFRVMAKHFADLLHIKGFVKNLPNKTVEICAIGEKSNLQRLVKELENYFGSKYIKNISINFIYKNLQYHFDRFEICY